MHLVLEYKLTYEKKRVPVKNDTSSDVRVVVGAAYWKLQHQHRWKKKFEFQIFWRMVPLNLMKLAAIKNWVIPYLFLGKDWSVL